MILLDTDVLIYASTDRSPFLEWARRTIAAGVSEDGAVVDAVSLAEICVAAQRHEPSRRHGKGRGRLRGRT
jgi:predicted nucleic acid-binding protein